MCFDYRKSSIEYNFSQQEKKWVHKMSNIPRVVGGERVHPKMRWKSISFQRGWAINLYGCTLVYIIIKTKGGNCCAMLVIGLLYENSKMDDGFCLL